MSTSERLFTVNAGSTSVKIETYDRADCERSLSDPPDAVFSQTVEEADVEVMLEHCLDDTVIGAAHRIVHVPESMQPVTQLDDRAIKDIERINADAPLHNAAALRLVATIRRLRPSLVQYGVADSAFHRTLSPVAKTYAIPKKLSEQGMQRIGYHGLSHEYAAHRASELAGIDIATSRIITAHLGGGSSLCAIRNGKSLDTTMGFTPLEGVPMATRSGSVDPGLLLRLLRNGISIDTLEQMLEHESGLLGISGISGDVRKLMAALDDPAAVLALDVLAWRVRAAIGALIATLGGIDLLVFTGGIGEHAAAVRMQICEGGLGSGISMDSASNSRNEEGAVHAGASAVPIYCVRARENWQLARMVCKSALVRGGDRGNAK